MNGKIFSTLTFEITVMKLSASNKEESMGSFWRREGR
jgi:hypothetical protein